MVRRSKVVFILSAPTGYDYFYLAFKKYKNFFSINAFLTGIAKAIQILYVFKFSYIRVHFVNLRLRIFSETLELIPRDTKLCFGPQHHERSLGDPMAKARPSPPKVHSTFSTSLCPWPVKAIIIKVAVFTRCELQTSLKIYISE